MRMVRVRAFEEWIEMRSAHARKQWRQEAVDRANALRVRLWLKARRASR